MTTAICRSSLEEIARSRASIPSKQVQAALKIVQSLDPAGVARSRYARVPAACRSRAGTARAASPGRSSPTICGCSRRGSIKEMAKQLGRPLEHVQIAVNMIRHLDPRPGLRYSGRARGWWSRTFTYPRMADDYIIQMNDEDMPQLRLNSQYRRMLDRDRSRARKSAITCKEKYASALQLMKNIEQRKQTILKVCQSIVRRQTRFSGARHR